MDILGSIDNASFRMASKEGGIYHLIFTRSEVVAARVMDNSERRMRVMAARTGTASTAVSMISPIAGTAMTYKPMQRAMIDMIRDSEDRGRNIEADLEKYLDSKPDGLQKIDYAGISGVEFAKGSLFSLPHVVFSTDNSRMKFRLVHDNYHKAGKLNSDTYQSYRDVLKKAFEEKLVVK